MSRPSRTGREAGPPYLACGATCSGPGGAPVARHLVEQRLEQVVVRAVHQRHIYVGVAQLVRSRQTTEAAADDHHAAATDGGAHYEISARRSARMMRAAASISARCENA
jgi:hypothetical protein